jgi:putative ABC transport system permease protein
VKQTSLAFNPADAVYVPTSQWRFADTTRWLVVRGQGNVAALTPAVKRAVWSVDKNQPIVRIATMAERVNVSAADRSLALRLFESFGIVALVLAAIGTYSLLSGGVVERTREIGLRTALGASRGSVIAMVLGQGMTLVGIGVAFGLIGAAITSSALETLLFGVSRLDFITYVGVVALLALVSAVACWIPARRAAQISPCIALKVE